jgi:rare lipoprotein A
MVTVRASTHVRNIAVLMASAAVLAACATPHPKLSNRLPAWGKQQPPGTGGGYKVGAPYQVGGIWYVPHEDPNYDATGIASWYGNEFHMKTTANGEVFDMNMPSAAHTTLPLPSLVDVTNLENGKTIRVRVNDRGPFVGGRVIDLSREAARELGYDNKGTANVRVRYVGPAPVASEEDRRYAAAGPNPATPPAPIPYTSLPTVAPPGAVNAQVLPPLSPVAKPVAVASVGIPPTTMASATYRIQAGAFSDQGNAQRVASQLAIAGPATVEPVQRDGLTLYRVMLQSTGDEGDAWALRDKVAASGYADARVVRPTSF